MFFNWLMDNNYFTLFLNRFTAKYNIKETTYTTILEKLQTINYQEFVFSILDTQFGQGDFDVNSFLNTVYLACSYCVILLRAVGGREGNQVTLYRNRIIAVSL